MGHITHTVGGDANLVNFKSAARVPIESLKCHFKPIQKGSGDPSPENVRPISGWTGCNVVRTGKNIVDLGTQSFTSYKLIDLSYSIKAGRYKLSATITSTDTDASTCLIGFWDKAGGSQIANYTLSRNTKSTATITLSRDCKRIYLYASNGFVASDGDTATWQDIQIEPGSTATTYEPYSGSAIPITFPVLGKNKFNVTEVIRRDGHILNNDGEETSSSISGYTQNFISVLPSTHYVLSGTIIGENNGVRFYFYDISKNWISRTGAFTGANNWQFTTPNNCAYIQIQYISNIVDFSTLQLEEGDTATTYEPYNSNNTVYGGYVDITKGQLVSQNYKITITDGSNFTYKDYTTSSRFSIKLTELGFSAGGGNVNVLFNYLKTDLSSTNEWTGCVNVSTGSINASLRVFFPASINSVELFSQYLAEHPLEVVFPSATKTYPFAPTQLNTLLNQNNIWSNTNDVTEVSYAIHDTAPIRAAKKRIIMNQPHIETTSGNIATFNTDMIAPIQSAKVYFNPIQEGSGDPSPDNVRNILGWDYYMLQSGEKNNQNIVFEQVGIAISTSRLVSATTRITSQDYIYLKTGVSYRLNIVTNNPNIKLFRIYRFPIDSNKLQDYTESLDASFPYIMSPQSTSGHEEIYKCKISLYIPGNSDISVSDILEATITPIEIDINNEPLYMNSTLFETIMTNKKNLLNPLYRDDIYTIDVRYYYSHSLPLPPGTYTLSCSTMCNYIRIYDSIYDTLLFRQDNSTYLTFTLNKLTDVKFLFTKDSTIHSATFQLEVGSSATTYEPYKYGLFGGYIDLISGELVQTHKEYTVSDFSWTKSSRGNMFIAETENIDKLKPSNNIISNTYKSIGRISVLTSLSDLTIGNYTYYSNSILYGRPAIMDNNYSTVETFVENMANTKIIAELENPITYQLTPHTLKTLRGMNNIWSNANGNIEIKYYTH